MAAPERFNDRTHAGKLLAKRLSSYANRPDVVVLALPRGGVPLGFVIAQALGVELDVMLVRKLGLPGHEEYAMGAVGAGGLRVLQAGLVDSKLVTAEAIEQCAERAMGEIARRDLLYRAGRAPLDLTGRCVILVDDGIATGASLRAAIAMVRQSKVATLVVAVPVGALESVAALAPEVDELVCLLTPSDFHAVSQWYRHFEQTSDAEVQHLLGIAWRNTPAYDEHTEHVAPAAAHTVHAAHAAPGHSASQPKNH
ncbi:MAG: phosphoribosyltransferase [Massilia sp.]|nr:phosphoribosyltransferase [Massilia sp.]